MEAGDRGVLVFVSRLRPCPTSLRGRNICTPSFALFSPSPSPTRTWSTPPPPPPLLLLPPPPPHPSNVTPPDFDAPWFRACIKITGNQTEDEAVQQAIEAWELEHEEKVRAWNEQCDNDDAAEEQQRLADADDIKKKQDKLRPFYPEQDPFAALPQTDILVPMALVTKLRGFNNVGLAYFDADIRRKVIGKSNRVFDDEDHGFSISEGKISMRSSTSAVLAKTEVKSDEELDFGTVLLLIPTFQLAMRAAGYREVDVEGFKLLADRLNAHPCRDMGLGDRVQFHYFAMAKAQWFSAIRLERINVAILKISVSLMNKATQKAQIEHIVQTQSNIQARVSTL